MLYFIFNCLGEFGPLILFVFSLYLLSGKQHLLFYYIFGFFANSILNVILKGIIQQPRPLDDEKLFNLALKNANKDVFKNGVPFDVFGMPSGHAQSVLFSTIFVYLSLKKSNILLIYLLVSFFTMVQRVVNNYHSLFQIVVGNTVGVLFAWGLFYMSQQRLKGIIREKKDDFGPI